MNHVIKLCIKLCLSFKRTEKLKFLLYIFCFEVSSLLRLSSIQNLKQLAYVNSEKSIMLIDDKTMFSVKTYKFDHLKLAFSPAIKKPNEPSKKCVKSNKLLKSAPLRSPTQHGNLLL